MEEGGTSDPVPMGTATPAEAIAAWKAEGRVYLVVRVTGDGSHGEDVEYVGSVSEEALAKLSSQEQRQALLEVVKLERARRRALASVETQGLVGPVTL